jgi:transposase
LPRYSPDFAPIEGAFSKLKEFLRHEAARQRRSAPSSHRQRPGHHHVRRRLRLL